MCIRDRYITVEPVTDLTANDDSASGNEDTLISGDVSANDSTTSGGTLSFALASPATSGTPVVNANGTFTYTPNANFNGGDNFTYTVTDAAAGESATKTVYITCLLYTSDAADERSSVDLGGRRIIKKKKYK